MKRLIKRIKEFLQFMWELRYDEVEWSEEGPLYIKTTGDREKET
jgi:hypothetical protein